VWLFVGVVLYAGYRPHSSSVAGAITIAAGLYELTPLKRCCRRYCHEHLRSGFRYGLYCVGSSGALMVMLAAVGVMSIAWMAAVGAVVLVQKLLPRTALVDVPLAAVLVGLGIAIVLTPASIPGLMPQM
jgi:predicted metal-binding membrane protein